MRFFAAALVFITLNFVTPMLAQCDFTVGPTAVSVGSAAFSGTITVSTASPGFCSGWTASSSVPWLKITSISNTVFPGAANYSVDANTSAVARSGVMTVASKTVTVTQAAAFCNFSISPKTAGYAVSGGAGFFMVQANCAWQAESGSAWIAVP